MVSPRPGVIVEFVGLPGAGKTTISHAVAAMLRAEGKTVIEQTFDITQDPDRRSRKAALALSGLCRHPRLCARGFYRILKSRQKSLRDFVSAAFNLLYISGLMEKISQSPGIHFIDQGYYNAFWTIYFSASVSEPESIDLQSLLASGTVTRPDLVVVVDARPETVLERLQVRPGAGSRLEQQSGSPDFDLKVEAAIQAFKQVRALLDAAERSHAGLSVETVCNEAALGEERFDDVKTAVRDAVSRVARARDQPDSGEGAPQLAASS